MKPVLILQHIDGGGPAYFAEYLERHGVPIELRRPDQGAAVPRGDALRNYAGICLCGGTQSVTAPEPWMHDEIALIREAARSGVPVIGHCLGGQLISAAFGGRVTRHAVEEFGWQRLHRAEGAAAGDWLAGAPDEPVCIQWHQDSFTLPEGAALLLTGDHCHNQAFVLGTMLAMQFHVEVTEQVVRHWAVDLAHLIPPHSASVQSAGEVLASMHANLTLNRALADSLYGRWLKQIA